MDINNLKDEPILEYKKVLAENIKLKKQIAKLEKEIIDLKKFIGGNIYESFK